MLGKATILGRVGNKESKVIKTGGDLTVLSIATVKKYRDSHGVNQEQTTWHNVNCFGKLADITNKYVQVGSLVFVEGDIQNKKIENGERAGQFAYSIHANEVKLLPASKKEAKESKTALKQDVDFEDSEIPF